MSRSYEQFKSYKEVEDFCRSKNLQIIKIENNFIRVANIINENNTEIAYLTKREKAYVSSLKDDTQWVMILE